MTLTLREGHSYCTLKKVLPLTTTMQIFKFLLFIVCEKMPTLKCSQTDGRTDGLTDRQTDNRRSLHRLSFATHGSQKSSLFWNLPFNHFCQQSVDKIFLLWVVPRFLTFDLWFADNGLDLWQSPKLIGIFQEELSNFQFY